VDPTCNICGKEPAYCYVKVGYQKGMPKTAQRVMDVGHRCLVHHPDANLIRSFLYYRFEIVDEVSR
jgi:hypothetical protein